LARREDRAVAIAMTDKAPQDWNGIIVGNWLESRISSARADQILAERKGYDGQDDCDAAAAEEMVCASVKNPSSTDNQGAFLADLKALLDRNDYVWRGVYNDTRFDRHVRAYVRKLTKMAKANAGFERTGRYQ
jgi:hypothetical protein